MEDNSIIRLSLNSNNAEQLNHTVEQKRRKMDPSATTFAFPIFVLKSNSSSFNSSSNDYYSSTPSSQSLDTDGSSSPRLDMPGHCSTSRQVRVERRNKFRPVSPTDRQFREITPQQRLRSHYYYDAHANLPLESNVGGHENY